MIVDHGGHLRVIEYLLNLSREISGAETMSRLDSLNVGVVSCSASRLSVTSCEENVFVAATPISGPARM